MIDLTALALTLGNNDFSIKNGTEFSVDDGATWVGLNGLTDTQRSTYDTELAALTTRRTSDTRIVELKQKLRDTDFVTLPDYDQAKPDVLAQRQTWREEIRKLEDN